MFFLLKRLFYPSSRFFCVSLHRIKKLASYAQDKPDTLFCIVHEPLTRYFYVVIIMSFRKTISWFLFPLTVWYAVGVCFRNLLFALGIKSQTAPPVTTIGVGNLCTGGSGKTPHVEYLLRLLSGSYETALLSRGYRRKTSGFVLDDGCHSPSRLGDEPSMLALKFPNVTVAVCEKRVEGVQQLLKRDPAPQLIVLDDVFQHRYLKPTVNILLTEYGNPYFKDHILPFGNLREFRSARRRADIVIVTKSPSSINPIDRHNFINSLKLRPHQKVFFSQIRYCNPVPLMGTNQLSLNTIDEALVVTGIAHPEPMFEYVSSCCSAVYIRYADHHRFTLNDLKHIRKSFERLKGNRKLILTTEKDAVRFRELANSDLMAGLPVYVLPIQVSIQPSLEFDFDQTIQSIVSKNVSFLDRMHKTKFNL